MEHDLDSHEEKTESLDNESHREVQEETEDILLVEQKYCTVCNLEQPIRSKHC